MKYTEDHEWLRPEGDLVVVGITEHASEQLGDVVFIDLPEVGREVEAGEEIVVIESVKAASDISAPIAGVITAVNEALSDAPGQVNDDAMRYSAGAGRENEHLVAEIDRFCNPVRHENHRVAGFHPDALKIGVHLIPSQSVQRAKRLVHQKQ